MYLGRSMSKYVTLAQLREAGACSNQLALFEKLFGGCAKVTEQTCLAVYDKFDWDWAAENLLIEPAQNMYQEAERVAWYIYSEAMLSARDTYYKTTIFAWKIYEEAETSNWSTYDKAKAKAFARAYNAPSI